MNNNRRHSILGLAIVLGSAVLAVTLAADTVPTDIEQPGTQPGEVAGFTSPDNCDNCHGGTANPAIEPGFGWRGGMMGNATRDPIFWATVAIAEQDFLPNADPAERGGAGDLCIRCHSVSGWINGHSTPTDGSGLGSNETDGVECEFCHLLVNPDSAVNISGTTEVQNTPFETYDPASGAPYQGSGQYVLNGGGTRLGPYSDADARHTVLASPFHRQAELCGTCHDVSNSAVGDLAWNHGAQEVMLAPGTFSGVPGALVQNKAAFNNPPYSYGIVERTFSEWKSSAFPALAVNDYGSLPADLKAGSIQWAYQESWDAGRSTADYEDGTVRTFTCQTCHMAAATGVGCNKPGTPTRTDLPRHDQTGAGYWMPDVVQYMDTQDTLLLGGGLTQAQRDALDAGKVRATELLQRAASVGATQIGNSLHVQVVNLTAHKLISGYPEGRRMWLNLKWRDAGGALVREDGAYGPIGRTVNDLAGTPYQVQSVIDLAGTVIYEASPGMDQQWAAQLLSLGYSPGLVLAYDRMTDAPVHTLGELGSSLPGTAFHTFHFVLNNVMTHDNRIPPYGFRYDDARLRNALPVPKTQYGNPGPGGTFDYRSQAEFTIPANAATVEVGLYYQQTSWEYIQFLWLGNDGQSTFLGQEGINMLDGWLHTAMSPPLLLASATTAVAPSLGVPGEARPMLVGYDKVTGAVQLDYTPACDATDNNVYYGDLAGVSTYAYAAAACSVGNTGTASFDPGLASAFFVIVGNNGVEEGSYGTDSSGAERPEHGLTPLCDRAQNLGGVVCE